MTVKDYALESKKDVKTILQILKENDIDVNNENDELDDEAIVLLDIICGSVTTEEVSDVEVDENFILHVTAEELSNNRQKKQTPNSINITYCF